MVNGLMGDSMNLVYDDGFCGYTNDAGMALTLYTNGVLELQEFDEGGTYDKVEMKLPEWLAEHIREAFVLERARQSLGISISMMDK